MALHFFLRSIARTKNKCVARCENFWITKPSECFSRTARQFRLAQRIGCAFCSRVNHEWTRMDTNGHEETCELGRSEAEGVRLGGPVSRFLRLIRYSHSI